jgi:hypothetical protein
MINDLILEVPLGSIQYSHSLKAYEIRISPVLASDRYDSNIINYVDHEHPSTQ